MFLNSNEQLINVYENSLTKNSDVGYCVIGYKLLVKGEQVVPQPYQGQSGCYSVYQDVISYLISIGIEQDDISFHEGWID